MREKQKMIIIRTACFLLAFFAAGAGFAFYAYKKDEQIIEREEIYEKLLAKEAAESFEALFTSLSLVGSVNEGKRNGVLSDIRLHSYEARNALGDISEDGGEIFAFLEAVSLISRNGLELGIGENSEFSLLLSYCERIRERALPQLSENREDFFKVCGEIFSDTVLQTLIYEKGYGIEIPVWNNAVKVSIVIGEREAKEKAREYLGENAYLESFFSKETGVYHFYGKNTSAIVNGKNGVVMQFLFDTSSGSGDVGREEAKLKAETFLSEQGFDTKKMLLSEEEQNGGLYIFGYSPIERGVVCESERITVGVSESTGRIRLYDAVNYYSYHRKKLNIPEFTYSEEKLRADYMGAENIGVYKIERADGVESFCYRFLLEGRTITVSALSGMTVSP